MRIEKEIDNIIETLTDKYGYKNRFEFLATLNGAENVGSTYQAKNLIVWLVFEETARRIANKLELEI